MADVPAHSDTPPPRLQLCLYVAGDAPNSLRARANLRQLTAALASTAVEVTEINVLDDPLRALEDGVLVTPTLVRLYPPPTLRIIGDLSDRYTVISGLGLEELLP